MEIFRQAQKYINRVFKQPRHDFDVVVVFCLKTIYITKFAESLSWLTKYTGVKKRLRIDNFRRKSVRWGILYSKWASTLYLDTNI